jgi:hypothetical protein
MIGGPRLISCDRLLRRRREDQRLLPVPFATSSDCVGNIPPRSGTSVPLTKRLKTGGAKPGALCEINTILNNQDRNLAEP